MSANTPAAEPVQRPVIFVGGAPRSGTTVTHALLCSSDKANKYCPEISFVRPLFNAYAVGIQNWRNHTQAFFKSPQNFKLHMRNQVLRSLHHIGLQTSKTPGTQPAVLVVKDPLLTPMFYWVHQLMGPHAKFVTVVRDPFNVTRSRQEVIEKMGRAFTGQDAHNTAAEYMQSYAHLEVPELQPSVFAFRYEDLTNPDVTARIADFTGLPDIAADKVWNEGREVKDAADANPWFSPKYHQPINTESRFEPLAEEFRGPVREVCAKLIDRFGYNG